MNFSQRFPLAPLRMAAMWQPGDLSQPEVQLCGLPEIAAGKICALLDGRTTVERDDLIDQAWQAVTPILDLEASEREFIDRLQVGELRLDLLVPGDTEMRERLEKWPPLQWKALNARKARPSRLGDPDTAGTPPV